MRSETTRACSTNVAAKVDIYAIKDPKAAFNNLAVLIAVDGRPGLAST